MVSIFEKLTWDIQKNIISFYIKDDLHKDLKFFHSLELDDIHDRNFKIFYYDSMKLKPEFKHGEYNLYWSKWIVKKIYRGEKPWIWLYEDDEFMTEPWIWLYEDDEFMTDITILKIWLKKIYKLRNNNKYGKSLIYILTRFYWSFY